MFRRPRRRYATVAPLAILAGVTLAAVSTNPAHAQPADNDAWKHYPTDASWTTLVAMFNGDESAAVEYATTTCDYMHYRNITATDNPYQIFGDTQDADEKFKIKLSIRAFCPDRT